MRCEFGYCIVCDKEIASNGKVNGHYTEVQMNWSNGSRMTIACCVDCAPKKIWETDKSQLTRSHFEAWDKMGRTYDRGVVLVE